MRRKQLNVATNPPCTIPNTSNSQAKILRPAIVDCSDFGENKSNFPTI